MDINGKIFNAVKLTGIMHDKNIHDSTIASLENELGKKLKNPISDASEKLLNLFSKYFNLNGSSIYASEEVSVGIHPPSQNANFEAMNLFEINVHWNKSVDRAVESFEIYLDIDVLNRFNNMVRHFKEVEDNFKNLTDKDKTTEVKKDRFYRYVNYTVQLQKLLSEEIKCNSATILIGDKKEKIYFNDYFFDTVFKIILASKNINA